MATFKRASTTIRRRCWLRTRPSFELLERRELPALSPGYPALASAGVYVALDNANDVVSFQNLDANTVRLAVNGTNYDYPRSAVEELHVFGRGGNDQIIVASDVTILTVLAGGTGDDSLVGGAGEDHLSGNLGNDTLIGGDGDDWLDAADVGDWGFADAWGNGIGGPAPASVAHDSVIGGNGDDSLWGNPTRDTLDGGAGTNDIGTHTDAFPLQVVLTYPGDEPPSYDDTVTISFINATTARATVNGVNFDFDRTLVNQVYVNADDGNDLITIDSSVDVPVRIYAGDGNDTVIGGGTNDSVFGGAGDDSLVGNDGNDTLFGEDGNDTLFGGNGNDSIVGGNGFDSIMGGPGNDTLVGNMGNDTIDGGGGDDNIILILGSDDYVVDSGGNDTLIFAHTGQGVTIDLSLNAGQRQTADAAGNGVILVGQFENVIGSPFDDWITGNALANRLDGGGGNDTLDGGGGDRDLFGKGDGSKPDRRAGARTDGDVLVGGDGNDWLDGGRGRDNLDGGAGDDTLVADPLVDTVNGGPGSNRTILIKKDEGGFALLGLGAPAGIAFDPVTGVLIVRGDADGPTDDHIVIAADAGGWIELMVNGVTWSADPLSPQFTESLAGASIFSVLTLRVRGLQGNDTISVTTSFVAAEHIVLAGGAGNDFLSGGDNAELLRGGRGDDTLLGHAGDDVLVGGRGDDLLDGGLGFDWASYAGAPKSVDVDLLKGIARGDGRDELLFIEDALGWLLTDEKRN